MIARRLVATLLLVSAFAVTARADDPARVWRTIETPHFHIHYYTLPHGGGEEPVAQRLATLSEFVYGRLTPYLGQGLKRKTHLVVTDDIDDYNGFAGVYPYPAITLYANSPDDRAELNDYDDWLLELLMHEFTHIIHTGTIGGPCAKIVNAVLGLGYGIIYPPNQFQPRWGLEGLAVFEESARTAAGRLHNSIWDMYLRAQTLEGYFQRLDQFSVTPNEFPYGNAAYLYGSALMRYIADTYGEQSLLRWSRDYGSSCIPGGLNRSIRHVTGLTWVQLHRNFHDALVRRYTAQRDAIIARGLTPTRPLTASDPQSPSRPVFTPDGKDIIFLRSDGYRQERMARLPADTPGPPRHKGTPQREQKTEVLTDAAGGPSISGDGRYLTYHQQTVVKTVYYYNDVYLYDRWTHTRTRLTEGARASNPAISPDGNWIVFERDKNSSRGLGMIARDGDGTIDMLIPAENMEHAYTPSFSPDGKSIAFSWWRKGGYRDIYTMDLKTRAITPITHDRAYDLEPRYSPDGQLLYFVSDRSGVYNLYAYELATQKLYQVTNVVNGVFDPAISPDGKTVVFVGFKALGYDLEAATLDRSQWRDAEPPIVDRPDLAVPEQKGPPLPSHHYNPIPTLIPFTWRPFFQPDGYGEIIGLNFSGSDVVGRHAWDLSIGFGTGRSDDVQFSANYSYSGLWPSLNMGVAHALQHRAGFVINGKDIDWDADTWSFGTSIDLPIYRDVVSASDLSFSYDWSYTRNLTPLPPPDPSALVPQLPVTGAIGGFGATWTYSVQRRFQYSISTEKGRYLSLSLGVGARALGSQFDVYSASWRYVEWIPVPWPSRFLRNHVLSLSYSGGYSGGDPLHRNNFYLGGYPQQNLLQSIYDFTRPGSASLRGYPYGSVYGDQFHVINVEYRFPIAWIEHGYETFPLYLSRLHGRFFVDTGEATSNGFDPASIKVGAGAELMLELTYAYYFPAALQLGYARGFMKGGGNEVYFLLNSPF